MIGGGGYITAFAVMSEIRHSASEIAFGSEISLARCEMFLRNVKEESASFHIIYGSAVTSFFTSLRARIKPRMVYYYLDHGGDGAVYFINGFPALLRREHIRLLRGCAAGRQPG